MTSGRQVFLSLVGLTAATVGLLGFLYVSFAFFGYQGGGMDWIYGVAGFFVIVWLVSAAFLLQRLIDFLDL